MLVAPAGAESEARVREQLAGMSELLDLRWVAPFRRYALIARWPNDDARWELHRRGEIGDAFDILGWFCDDIDDAGTLPVSLDGVEQLVTRIVSRADNARIPWRKRLADVIAQNTRRRREQREEMRDLAVDAAEYRRQQVFKLPIVPVTRTLES